MGAAYTVGMRDPSNLPIAAPHSTEVLAALDALDEAGSADIALGLVENRARLLAGAAVVSVQQNVTTADDPVEQILLRRFYSSAAEAYPVSGTKRKLLTPWTERIFLDGRAFVGEGSDTLERCFDDHAQMRSWGLQSFVNVPLLRGAACYATFNVFAARPCWQPAEVLAIRLLALAAARWVPCAAGLSYCLKGRSISPSLES
jgi:hypothetical protein